LYFCFANPGLVDKGHFVAEVADTGVVVFFLFFRFGGKRLEGIVLFLVFIVIFFRAIVALFAENRSPRLPLL
jgi:hypothetical protein